jgi:hypothetical protein
MPAVDRLIPDLGPDFDGRWQRTSQALRRELIGEVRSLYRLLTEEDLPMLDSLMPAPAPAPATPVKPPAPQQTSLFGQADTAATKDNPFLPQSIRERLQHSQPHTAPRPQPTTPSPAQSPAPPSHEQVDLERELRLRLGPIIETLIDAHIDTLKGELRVRLRAEMDRLIADHLRK